MESKPGSVHSTSRQTRREIADNSKTWIKKPPRSRTQTTSPAAKSRSYRRPGQKVPSQRNRILAALPAAEYERLRSHLRLVPLKRGKVLWEPDQPIGSVYFPNSGMISLMAVMANGQTVEVGMIGRHGFAGTPVLLGVQSAPFRAVVQIEGWAFQIQSSVLCQTLSETPCLERMLRRYVYINATRATQAAACNCLHNIGERLSCLLAISRYIAGSDSLPFTHEFLAEMLGCRRSSVTAEISSLKNAGAIRCGRGRVCVVNRAELERRACECYHTVRRLSQPLRAN